MKTAILSVGTEVLFGQIIEYEYRLLIPATQFAGV